MATVDEMIRLSYDGSEMDLTSVIGEFPFGDDNPGKQIPIKKLSDEFDGCVKSDEYMKVFLRVRPIKTSLESTIVVDTDTSITTTAPDISRRAQYTKTETRNYIFSKVYGPQAAQEEVYEATAMPLSKRLLNGENSCLFAYGMTASGKTHTIQGTASKNPGILPRLISEILSSLQADTKVESSLSVSMLEIYQERIYDLLSTSKEKLTIRDGNGKVEVNKLSVHPIASSEDAVKLMDIASGKRSKSTTCLNTVSSRSHAVYTVTLERTNKKTRETSSCAFYLVDLAGAERANRTKATAQQQVEANSINVSLMKLWRCLQGIRKAKGSEKLDSSGPQDIVPFRESKLTHLLMPMLGRVGAGGVSMIACVNPQGDDYDETLSILGNASLAMKIKEVGDIGRTTGNQQLSQSAPLETDLKSANAANAANGTNAPTLVSRTISLSNLAEAKDKEKKRKRSDGKTDKNDKNNNEDASKRPSHSRSNSSNGLKNSSSNNNTGGGGLKATKSAKIINFALSDADMSEINAASSADTFDGDDAHAEEMNALRTEIYRLKEENMRIVNEQISREREIRVEVAEEMAVRSTHLLEQIQDLRGQLAVYECNSVDNLQKSAKKARKKQRTEQQEETVRDLAEAEEELERVKGEYEQQLASLKADVSRLQAALSSATGSSAVAGETSQSSSAKLSKRFSALKENAASANITSNSVSFSIAVDKNLEKRQSKSPASRSPLQQITNNPMFGANNANNANANAAAVSDASVPVKSIKNLREQFENAAAIINNHGAVQPISRFRTLRSGKTTGLE